MSRGVVVVGSPHDKRGAAFAAAWQKHAGTAITHVGWDQVARDAAVLAGFGAAGDFLRVESPGSDPDVWTALARRGGLEDGVDPAEPRPGRAWFGGLSETLHAVASHTAHLVPTHPAETTLGMMDKRLCHRTLAAAGIPVPPSLDTETIRSAKALREALQTADLHAVFVKPRWGSSGAGVLAYRWQGDRERLTTTARLDGEAVRNDKRLRTYTDRASVDRLLERILRDGAVVERWLPKAGTAGGPFDPRVVVIAGAVAQRVARVGRGPITNLHLDAVRLDPDEALAPLGARVRDEVHAVCLAAAACFPGHLAIGVDVMVDPHGRPFVLEMNAWGDYLPGLLQGGLDTYETEVLAMLRPASWSTRGTSAA